MREFNFVCVLQTIQKLKAAVQILVAQNNSNIEEIREMYFKNSVILINEDIAKKYKEERDEVTRFFEHDEREELSIKEEVLSTSV